MFLIIFLIIPLKNPTKFILLSNWCNLYGIYMNAICV